MRVSTGWLEGPDGIFSLQEAVVIGINIVSEEEAFKPLPPEKDAAAAWLEQHDPEKKRH